MAVNVGDTLSIDMTLSGTVWTQVVTDVETKMSVEFAIDMKGQAQNIAYFQLEGGGQHQVAPTVFTNTTITFRPRLSAWPAEMVALWRWRSMGTTSPLRCSRTGTAPAGYPR
jgi:hypothetical protein